MEKEVVARGEAVSELGKVDLPRFLAFLAILLTFCAVLACIYRPFLFPLFCSFIFSFLLTPIVDYAVKLRIPKLAAILLLLLLAFGVFPVLVFWFITPLYEETVQLLKLAPKVADTIVHTWLSWLKVHVMKFAFIEESMFDSLVEQVRNMVPITNQLQRALATIWETVPRFLGTIVNFVMIPLISFFVLKDGNLIKEKLTETIPADLKGPLCTLWLKLCQTLKEVLKGQVIVAFCLGILYIIGFNLVGIPSATTIGLISGICRFIPYFDIVVGGILSIFAAFSDFSGFGQLFGIGLVFLVVQTLDGMFITPKVLGEKAGLHPLVVIMSVIAFGDLFGFFGVLIAIPLVAIVRTLFILALPFYRASRFYRN